MFIHQGRKRTAKHNLQIASLLSFVAGLVNVAGFLAVATLTTNVTGHFAFFVDAVFKLDFSNSLIYFLYIFSFFLGSFFSSFAVAFISRRNADYVYIVPTSIESFNLLCLAVFGKGFIAENPNFIACSLLFAMGLQNSLVTRISNATVRTTHLTGLFTDLGIELSQLLFYREHHARTKLLASVKLRLTIIGFFFMGIVGGILYSALEIRVLLLGTIILLLGIVYDNLKLKVKLLHRKHQD